MKKKVAITLQQYKFKNYCYSVLLTCLFSFLFFACQDEIITTEEPKTTTLSEEFEQEEEKQIVLGKKI